MASIPEKRAMDNEQPEGGTDWELKQAERQIIDGGAPEIALGLLRYTEAMRNVITQTLIPDYIASLERIIDRKNATYTSDLRELLRVEFVQQDVRYKSRTKELQDDVIARMEAQWSNIDAFQREARAAWEDTARGLGKNQEDIASLRQDMGAQASQIQTLASRLDRKRKELDAQALYNREQAARDHEQDDRLSRLEATTERLLSIVERLPEIRDKVGGDG